MDRSAIGSATLAGWRGKVADAVGPPVARRTPFDEDAVRAAVGVAFLVLSIWYVASSLRRLGDAARR